MPRIGVRKHLLVGRVRGLEPKALRDVQRGAEGHWKVTGPRPLIRLLPADGQDAPTGDVRLEFALTDVTTPVHATLSIDTGGGLEGASLRLPLRALRPGDFACVVTLPASTVSIGLDPGPLGGFRLGAVRAVELSAVGAVLAHGGPQLGRLVRRPTQLAVLAARALRLLRYRGPQGVLERLRRGTQRQLTEEGYQGWARRYASLGEEQRSGLRARVSSLDVRPLFSIVIAPGEASEAAVRRTLHSLQQQIYPRWELCVGEQGVADKFRPLAEALGKASEVRWSPHAEALGAARGELVLRVKLGDALAEHALFAVAEVFARDPNLALVYTDGDGEDAEGRLAPAFKPDWSPELLRSYNYVGRSAFFRADAARALGGWHSGPGDVSWHELLVRAAMEVSPERVVHLPYVLVHSGKEQSPSSEEWREGVNAVQTSLDRAHLQARAEAGRRPRTYRVRFAVPTPTPLVSVVIPTRDRLTLLRRCIQSLKTRTDYQPLEVLVVDNDSSEGRTLAYLQELEMQGAARVLRYREPFNYSAMNNLAAREARGAVLCLLNNDVEAIEPGWLTEMVGLALQKGVGAVGAKLLYPNNTVQHAGAVAGLFGVAAHNYLREPREADGYLLQLQTTREVSAVTAACLVVGRERFLEVGGLDEAELPVAFNDVDFCFKLLKAGYRNLWTPYAELYHRESASRGTDERGKHRRRFLREESVMRQRWGALIERDPYYSPNLSLDSNLPCPAWPPRVVWPLA
ncbi:MAG: glycosyltransferase family 2 protein [Myxococcaceae bacterium]